LSASPAQEAEAEEEVAPLPEAAATKDDKPAGIETTACLDTGSNAYNFIRRDLADELVRMGAKVVDSGGQVRLACKAEPVNFNKAIKFKYCFLDQLTQTWERVTVVANVLDGLTTPLIIGLRSIFEYKLLCRQLPALCCKNELCKHDVTGKNSALRQKTGGADSDKETSNLCPRRTDGRLCVKNTAHPLTLQENRTAARTDHPTRVLQGPGESDVCELCQFKRVSSRDLFGSRDDSDSDPGEAAGPTGRKLRERV